MGVFNFFEQVAKPKTIAILYENTDFGNSTSKAMKEYCDAHGVNVVLSEGYQAGGVDFKPILQKVKSLRPDIVYMVSYLMDASLLMRRQELDINPQAFIGGGADTLRVPPERGRGVEYCMRRPSGRPGKPGRQGVLRQLRREFNKEPDYTAPRHARGLRPGRHAQAGQGPHRTNCAHRSRPRI